MSICIIENVRIEPNDSKVSNFEMYILLGNIISLCVLSLFWVLDNTTSLFSSFSSDSTYLYKYSLSYFYVYCIVSVMFGAYRLFDKFLIKRG